jgi:hypothetical protein
MYKIYATLFSILFLTGCMATPQQPVRPILSCVDCKGLNYYGPQMPTPDAPGVAMAKVLVGGAVKIAGVAFAVDAIKSTSQTIADAGKYAIVEQPTPTVVTQPDPTVVVQPDPTVITQPPPIIVEQPAPIIVDQPILVQ